MKSILKGGVLLIILLVTTNVISQNLNSEGWTILDIKNAEKIIYISSVEGNDATAQIYESRASVIGNNPFLPSGAIKAFKTIEEAKKIVNNGEATWILFKRGDVFTEGLFSISGKSAEKPLVFASYGAKKEMPLFHINGLSAFRNNTKTLKYVYVIGLSFYVPTRNPDSAEFTGFKEGGPTGISLLCLDGRCELNTILIEGCVFRFFRGSSIQRQNDGVVKNIKLRRNLILDNYGHNSHSQGLFTGLVDGFLLEENIFDHNGWYKQQIEKGQSNSSEGQATKFNHNTYFQNAKNVIFKENAFYRTSSIGTKWTANDGEASASNIEIVNNLYYDFEVGISIGGNKTDAPYRFKNITIKENVFNSAGLSRQTNRTLGWNVEINDWDNGVLASNYIVHQNNDEVDNGNGIILKGQNRNVTIENNKLYNLKNTNYLNLDIDGMQEYENTVIKNNKFFKIDEASKHVFGKIAFPSSGLRLEDNKYIGKEPSFRVNRKTETLEEWSTTSKEDITNSKEVPDYKDPTRSLERYVTEVLGLTSMDDFYTSLREQNILNWRKEYTTKVINDWIKNGFKKEGALGIDDIDEVTSNKFLIYNYGDGSFKLQSNVLTLVDTLEVLDLNGKVLYEVTLKDLYGDIYNLSSGLYFFRFMKENQQVTVVEKYLKY